MAIKKNINPGDTLWKEVVETTSLSYDRETGRWMNRTGHRYIQYILVSRRARSNGTYIPEKLVPFFEALNIRIERALNYSPQNGEGQYSYLAIGVEKRSLPSESIYQHRAICPEAERHYQKLPNNKLGVLLIKRQNTYDEEVLTEMKDLLTESQGEAEIVSAEASEDWPQPPEFQTYSM